MQQAKDAVDNKQSKTFHFDIQNTDRSVGATLSGYIAQKYGDQSLTEQPIKLNFNGTAGQSFGVWNASGVELTLTCDANDYVGQGMAGGRIGILPPIGSAFLSHEATIIGNTCYMVLQAVSYLQQVRLANVLQCVIQVQSVSLKELVIMVVNI